jgi:hypothetical protein
MRHNCRAVLFLTAAFAVVGCDFDNDTGKTITPAKQPAATPQTPAPSKVETAPRPESASAPAAAQPVKVEAPATPQPKPASPSKQPAPKKEKKLETPAIKLSGKGDQASSKFHLQAGLSTWHVTHEGRSNVQISLLTDQGKEIDMPVNQIGRYDGVQVVRVPKEGTYLLNVKADGKWTVTIEQPRPSSAKSLPLAAHGDGPNVSPFVSLPKGLSVFKVTHKGKGVFRVKLFNVEGKLIEQVTAQIGAYEGSKAVTLAAEGIHIIGVFANGPWTVDVE